MNKQVILTGLRANAEFHLGNYLGGILPMVELQQKHAGRYQVNMFVPDLHSFTTPIDHSKLYRQTIDNLKIYVAAGLDVDNPSTFVYRQSSIPAHSELMWILGCFTGFGELSRMTQFKDKRNDLSAFANNATPDNNYKGDAPSVSAGLFYYPVLMAADILLYGATWVPLGDDQKQHLELARDIALRVNNKFGELFTIPSDWKKQLEFVSRDNGVRIRSLRNPDKKMSKSVSDPAGTILLSDTPDEAAKKIMSATTDSIGTIRLDWEKQPGISNLLQISALLAEQPFNHVVSEWEGKTSYGDLKNQVATQVADFLSELQSALATIDERQLLVEIEKDEAAMRKVADATLLRVQKAVGLRQN